MATAAELKARLAKYAQKQPTQSSVRSEGVIGAQASNTRGSGSNGASGQTAVVGTPVVGEGTHHEQVVVQESPSVAEQSRIEGEVNEQIQRAELPDNGFGRESSNVSTTTAATVAGAERQTSELPLQHGTLSTVVLSDQLQSTEVVVVEREIGPQVREERTEETVTDLDTSNPVHQNFLQRLADLETALLARDPLMKTHLGEIHKHMIQYEEIANLLRPEEIAKIMAAQQQHTGIVLRAEAVGRSKAATTKKAAKLGVDDL
jgi:hypothetical protein